MSSPTFPKLADRIFAVRAAWRRQVPLRVRIETVRRSILSSESVSVNAGAESDPLKAPAQASQAGGPPVKEVNLAENHTQVA